MKDSEIIEVNIETAKEIQKLRDNALKLIHSQPYKDVIEDAYFREEAARLVMAKLEPLTPDQLATMDRMMYGIPALKNFITSVLRRGTDIDNGMEAMEEELQISLEEEVSE